MKLHPRYHAELSPSTQVPIAGRSSYAKSTIEEGPRLLLHVREELLVRDLRYDDATLYYLSLFDDEIDARFECFLAGSRQARWDESTLLQAAFSLEPTDAVVVACPRNGILVARGGASNFPIYWTTTDATVRVSTSLPVGEQGYLSKRGALAAVLNVGFTLQTEPNFTRLTPVVGWFRCRRGAVTTLSPSIGQLSEKIIDFSSAFLPLDRRALANATRTALTNFGRRLGTCSKALVELSGGFDSTLAAIAALEHDVELLGVSLEMPYYEFRHEEGIQQAVARTLRIERITRDGTAWLPFAPSDWRPRLDEPATCVVSLARHNSIAVLAASVGASRILVGHGGDHLFCENMLESVGALSAISRAAFTRSGWSRCLAVLEQDQIDRNHLKRSTLSYVHDSRLDLAFKSELGVITRTPFTDLEVALCGIGSSRLANASGALLGKKLLEEAFAAKLPKAVIERKGKVCWDGVCARAYAQHASVIANEIEYAWEPLERLGLNVRWLVRRVGELGQWYKTSYGSEDKEVIAAYALATWMRSWGFERASDCGWT